MSPSSWARLRFAVGLAAIVGISAASSTRAQDLELEAVSRLPFSPFGRVTYEWKRVAGVPTVVLTRDHAHGFGQETALAVVPDGVFEGLFAAASACRGPGSDADPPDTAAVLVVRWTAGPDVVRRAWARADDAAPCLEAIRASAELLDVPPYEAPFWAPGTFGTLRALSTIPARVFVDDRDVGRTTPVHDLRLSPGEHSVRWVALASAEERVERVTIAIGMTTSVRVRFEVEGSSAARASDAGAAP